MGTKPLGTKAPQSLIEGFQAAYNYAPDFVVRAPGRVDLLGAHTDYNEGWVLTAAIDRAVWLAARALPTSIVSVRTLDALPDQPDGDAAAFRLTELEAKQTLDGTPLPGWVKYAAGVAWSLQAAGFATPGSELALTSNIPIGAGLSSSAAVEVAYALTWAHITGWEIERMELAQICRRAENEYVGVGSGLMDQFSSLFGRKKHALMLDCRTLDWTAVSLPKDVTLIVADTGTRRMLSEGSYNKRRLECEQAVAALEPYLPTIRALRDVSAEQFEAYADVIPEPARQRAQHVIAENERVQQAAADLKEKNSEALGALMDDSFTSARDLFDASGPALNAMWEASQGHPARLGGRFLGAGWAGCMLFLAQRDGANDFISYLRERYEAKTNREPRIYALQADSGAQVMRLPS